MRCQSSLLSYIFLKVRTQGKNHAIHKYSLGERDTKKLPRLFLSFKTCYLNLVFHLFCPQYQRWIFVIINDYYNLTISKFDIVGTIFMLNIFNTRHWNCMQTIFSKANHFYMSTQMNKSLLIQIYIYLI